MQYNQPYGVSDPNAAYINGNPSTGTMGSIPPAASIEYPQREIVAAIEAAGLTPDNADLTQLLKTLKMVDVFNIFKIAHNGGNASQWSAAIPLLPTMPPPQGTMIWFAPGYNSVIGGTVFSVNGSAFAPVVNADLSPITQGDVLASAWVGLFFDNTNWRIVAGSTRRAGTLPLLTKNTNWYVNGGTGSDTTYDGTSATVTSATVGPFKTIGRGAAEVVKYNMNGYDQFINIADGTYSENVVPRALNGSGTVHFVGNDANPQNVTVTTSTATGCCFLQSGGVYTYEGMRLTTGAGALDCLAIANGIATAYNLRFGPCARYHMSSGWSGSTLNLVAGGNGFVIEAGANCVSHVNAELAAAVSTPFAFPTQWPSVNILGAVSMSGGFVSVTALGVVELLYGAIAGAANVTGPKYAVSMNGVLSSGGNGVNYYPGNSPGTLATGGQYS